MTMYYYQDIFYILVGFLFTALLAGYSFFRKPCSALVWLSLLLSLTGVADAICHYTAVPVVLLLAESGLVLCCTLALTIFLRFVLPSLPPKLIYLPALLLTAAYALTPWLVRGITAGAYGFELKYAPGYWLLIGFVALYALLTVLFSLPVVKRSAQAGGRDQSLLLLFVLGLCVFYYGSALVVPFFYAAGNIASPLPLTFAVMLLVYSCLKYGYFAS
jgi:hypothetical protein